MDKVAVFIVVLVLLNMCTGNKASRIKNPAIATAVTILDQTARVWGWYKFPQDAMGIPDDTGKIVQEVINELGKVNIEFIPTAHAEEASLHSANDVELYNIQLSNLEAQCRDELFSTNNSRIENDVEIHYFMSDCLKQKGLSENELAYRQIYKHFNSGS